MLLVSSEKTWEPGALCIQYPHHTEDCYINARQINGLGTSTLSRLLTLTGVGKDPVNASLSPGIFGVKGSLVSTPCIVSILSLASRDVPGNLGHLCPGSAPAHLQTCLKLQGNLWHHPRRLKLWQVPRRSPPVETLLVWGPLEKRGYFLL